MSTRCNVTLYKQFGNEWKKGPILYHDCDGFPDAMFAKLRSMLEQAIVVLKNGGCHVNSESLAAMLVAGSVQPNHLPQFQPCRETHDDIDYRYHVYVDSDAGEIHAKDRHGHAVGSVVIDTGGAQ